MTETPTAGWAAEDQLAFAWSLLNLFDPADARVEPWRVHLEQTSARLFDDTYRLAVIGEYSTGKSTFINAVLEAELFASAQVETTGAAVRIRHGTAFTVRAAFHDGSDWRSVNPKPVNWYRLRPIKDTAEMLGAELSVAEVRARLSRMDARGALRVLTTDASVAPRVTSVEVTYPAPILAGGLIIIDTPGNESGHATEGGEHTRIAREAVAEADAAVIVMRQEKIMPMSLRNFLRDSLDEGLLARCGYVVTWADKTEPEEFDDLRAAAVSTVREGLGVNAPPVVWTAPVKVMERLRGKEPTAEDLKWVERFECTRGWLRRLVESRRLAAVEDTALRGVQEIIRQLSDGLADEVADLERRQRELRKTAPADMNAFLADRRDRAVQALEEQARSLRGEIVRRGERASDAAEPAVRGELANCQNGGQLEAAVRDCVLPLVRDRVRAFAEEARAETERSFLAAFHEVLASLNEAFVGEYAKLNSIDPAPLAGIALQGRAGAAVSLSDFAAATTVAADDAQRDKVSMGGGAGIGALLGTLFFPGVGTVIGGGIGAALGALFTEPITVVRERATTKALESTRSLFIQVRDGAVRSLNGLSADAVAELDRQVAWYRDTFAQAVGRLREAHTEAERDLAARCSRFTGAADEAAARAQAVADRRAGLRHVGGVAMTDPYGGCDD